MRFLEELDSIIMALFFNKEYFEVSVAFDNINEKVQRKIANLFTTDKLCDLTFDEFPYKVHKAKVQGKQDFSFVAFKDIDTGERVYKGEGRFSLFNIFLMLSDLINI